jgi:hypothetical protein
MSFHDDPWETPDAWEQDAPERWERAEQAEREDEAAQDRLTRDAGESGRPAQKTGGGVTYPADSVEVPAELAPAARSKPRPDYDPRVDHPERYMRDGVWQVDV